MFYKPEIRQKIRSQRKYLDKQTIEQSAQQVAAQVIHFNPFINGQRLGIYLPHENELDTHAAIRCALDLEKQLFLPIVPGGDDKVLTFSSYHPNNTLIKNKYNILEPDPNTTDQASAAELDAIFLPLVAFDKTCQRIGRGAGYYDHTLAFMQDAPQKKPTLIGLGYEFQKIDHIEPARWDIPLDYVITEMQIYQR